MRSIDPPEAHPRRRLLEELYEAANHRDRVHPDPVEFLYAYDDPLDREIIALVTAALAYGRVSGIRRSAGWVIERLRTPRAILEREDTSWVRGLQGFRHRFSTEDELTGLLRGIRSVLQRYGSLRDCFLAGLSEADPSILPALQSFVSALNPSGHRTSLLSPPARGSACKRLNLFLRWLVRCDAVDPGGWEGVGAARLIIPLDTHMFRIARRLGLTSRVQPDLTAALEITSAFRAIRPDDPVRYDFALTRLGMQGVNAERDMIHRWHAAALGSVDS